MPTQTPLTDEINALTTYANTITGASDTCLSDAVATLADGYGGGGSSAEEYLASGVWQSGTYTFNVTTMGRAFASTTGAFELRLPNATTASIGYIAENSSCTALFAPNLILGGRNSFSGSKLVTAVIKHSSMYLAFQNCANLIAVDLTSSGGKIDNMFSGTKLATLIIRGNSVADLTNITAFSSTPFASGGTGGTLYVPSALISSYQSASNWSTILGYANNQILAIEGSQYENYYADGTPIE